MAGSSYLWPADHEPLLRASPSACTGRRTYQRQHQTLGHGMARGTHVDTPASYISNLTLAPL
jgi:hypothetical protein